MKKISSILIITIYAAFLFSCGRTIDEDNFVVNRDALAKTAKPGRFYRGDSSLNISFTMFHDSTGRLFKTNRLEEGIVETFQNDSFMIVNSYRILESSSYNGACEARKDTLFVYYWIDSVGCMAAQSSRIMQYKIKKRVYKHIRVEYLDNKYAPNQKWCEEDLKSRPRPKFHKGDSAFTLSFAAEFKPFRSKKNGSYDRDTVEISKKKKTIVLDVFKKCSAASVYNGSAEMVGDKLYLYWWMDSLDCLPVMVRYKFTYIIPKVDYKEIQFKYIDREEVPYMKRCE